MSAPEVLSPSLASQADPASAGSAPAPARQHEMSLVQRISDGDRAALDEAAQSNFGKVYSVARRMLGDAAEAEDMAQEAFLKLWKSPPVLTDDGARLSTWLYRVTANLCIDFVRKRRPGQIEEGFDVASDETGAEEKVAEKQTSDAVGEALTLLPLRQRTALVLTYYEGLSNRDASEILGISVDALESLLARARRALKQQLESHWREMLDTLETARP